MITITTKRLTSTAFTVASRYVADIILDLAIIFTIETDRFEFYRSLTASTVLCSDEFQSAVLEHCLHNTVWANTTCARAGLQHDEDIEQKSMITKEISEQKKKVASLNSIIEKVKNNVIIQQRKQLCCLRENIAKQSLYISAKKKIFVKEIFLNPNSVIGWLEWA